MYIRTINQYFIIMELDNVIFLGFAASASLILYIIVVAKLFAIAKNTKYCDIKYDRDKCYAEYEFYLFVGNKEKAKDWYYRYMYWHWQIFSIIHKPGSSSYDQDLKKYLDNHRKVLKEINADLPVFFKDKV